MAGPPEVGNAEKREPIHRKACRSRNPPRSSALPAPERPYWSMWPKVVRSTEGLWRYEAVEERSQPGFLALVDRRTSKLSSVPFL